MDVASTEDVWRLRALLLYELFEVASVVMVVVFVSAVGETFSLVEASVEVALLATVIDVTGTDWPVLASEGRNGVDESCGKVG
jgi:hypothetical protein